MRIGSTEQWFYDHSHEFDKWWNAEKFNWNKCSGLLIDYCSEHLDKWWAGDKFNWAHSYLLVMKCHKKFDLWWDAEKFDWTDGHLLILYCYKNFESWWNPGKFDWGYKSHLCANCYEHFDLWYDPDHFEMNELIKYKRLLTFLGLDIYELLELKIKDRIQLLPKEKQLECTLKWIK